MGSGGGAICSVCSRLRHILYVISLKPRTGEATQEAVLVDNYVIILRLRLPFYLTAWSRPLSCPSSDSPSLLHQQHTSPLIHRKRNDNLNNSNNRNDSLWIQTDQHIYSGMEITDIQRRPFSEQLRLRVSGSQRLNNRQQQWHPNLGGSSKPSCNAPISVRRRDSSMQAIETEGNTLGSSAWRLRVARR